MERIKSLLEPQDCALLLVDFQAGHAFGVESSARQTVLHNANAWKGIDVLSYVCKPLVFGSRAGSRYFLSFNVIERGMRRMKGRVRSSRVMGGGYGIGLTFAREMIHPG